jgi:hypoxanthine phosphoribosyltransferase
MIVLCHVKYGIDMITSTGSGSDMPCELVSWTQFNSLVRQLAHQIRAANIEVDMIVAIGRGGYMPARILSDLLGVMNLTSFKIEHYQGSRKAPQAIIKYPLVAAVDQQHILLVDDVSDSGDTFHVALDHIKSKGTPARIQTAVIHHKTVSTYVPDFFAKAVREWRWIIYPWAITEDLAVLIQAMQPESTVIGLLRERLSMKHGIAVSVEQVEDALELIKQQVEHSC